MHRLLNNSKYFFLNSILIPTEIVERLRVDFVYSKGQFSDLFEDYWRYFEDRINTKLLHKVKIDENGSNAAQLFPIWIRGLWILNVINYSFL